MFWQANCNWNMRHFNIEMKAEEELGKQRIATTAAQQLNWKKSCEKKIWTVGKNKNKRKTHRHCRPHATSSTRMVVACSYCLDRLREGGPHGQLNNNLTVNKCWEKFEMKKITTEANSPSTSPPCSRWHKDGDDGTFFLDRLREVAGMGDKITI